MQVTIAMDGVKITLMVMRFDLQSPESCTIINELLGLDAYRPDPSVSSLEPHGRRNSGEIVRHLPGSHQSSALSWSAIPDHRNTHARQ